MSTAIQWTDETWNPTTGCTKISPGCANCYIERTPAFRIAGRKFDGRGRIPLQLHAHRLETPLHWKKPRRVFVNSMSDLFHENLPDAYIDSVFAVMALAPEHTFQVLTKRADRMRSYLSHSDRHTAIVNAMDMPSWLPAGRRFPRVPENWPLSNVWLGVSVESQQFADERIPLLLQTPAAVRFISAEPLLGPVDLTEIRTADWMIDALTGEEHYAGSFRRGIYPHLDWVIVGGESGPGARPFDLAWARSIVAQCQSAGVPVFVKQLGAKPKEVWNGVERHDVLLQHRMGGDPDEWPIDLRVREYPV